jgi:hypothetical protein
MLLAAVVVAVALACSGCQLLRTVEDRADARMAHQERMGAATPSPVYITVVVSPPPPVPEPCDCVCP